MQIDIVKAWFINDEHISDALLVKGKNYIVRLWGYSNGWIDVYTELTIYPDGKQTGNVGSVLSEGILGFYDKVKPFNDKQFHNWRIEKKENCIILQNTTKENSKIILFDNKIIFKTEAGEEKEINLCERK